MDEARTTAIIGVGGIGSALARNLVRGGERVVVAAKSDSKAVALAAAGFEPVKAGGLRGAGRLELPDGDLHQWGGLGGKLLDAEQARAAVAAGATVPQPAQGTLVHLDWDRASSSR